MLSINHRWARSLLVLLVVLLPLLSVQAQMKAEGPFCGQQFFSDLSNGGQIDWGNALMARCDEDASRAYTAPARQGFYSHFLHINGFGFSIPDNAEISGIEVVVIRKANRKNALKDRTVRLVHNGQVIGENMASPDRWEDDWTAVFYGGKNELWGKKWSARDLNRSDFGIAIDVEYEGEEARAEIDEVLITIHFSESAPDMPTVKWSVPPSKFTCYSIGS